MNDRITIALIGAGGKMGSRLASNLRSRSEHLLLCSETSPAAIERMRDNGFAVMPMADAVADADIVILAVPDTALGVVSAQALPLMRSDAILLTLDPAAEYAGQIEDVNGIRRAVAHPCHPSVFLQRTTPEEVADSFGGIAAIQDVVAAFEHDDEPARQRLEEVIRLMYGPVETVHWITVKQLAYLEPTMAETVACMLGDLLKEALDETVRYTGISEAAAKAMMHGHVQVALANSLRGDNPYSEACYIAMDYGRSMIVKQDWKRIFQEEELDGVLKKMLKIDTEAS